jgi:hypothetical protein
LRRRQFLPRSLLAAAELVRIAAKRRFVEAYCPHGLRSALTPIVRVLAAMNGQRFTDNLLHIQARVQGAKRILEDDLHVAAQPPQLSRPGTQHVFAIEDHFTGVGFDQA